jgi:hypothetical protein
MAKISRRNFFKSLGIGLGTAGVVTVGAGVTKYLMAQGNPPQPPVLKEATVVQEGSQEKPPELPLENHLPDIYKKLGTDEKTFYITNACSYDPKAKDQRRIILQLNRKAGKGYMNVVAKRFSGNEDLFKSGDQATLGKVFEDGSLVKQFNIFGADPWGESKDNDNYIDPNNGFAPTGIGGLVDYAVRREFSGYLKCIASNLK